MQITSYRKLTYVFAIWNCWRRVSVWFIESSDGLTGLSWGIDTRTANSNTCIICALFCMQLTGCPVLSSRGHRTGFAFDPIWFGSHVTLPHSVGRVECDPNQVGSNVISRVFCKAESGWLGIAPGIAPEGRPRSGFEPETIAVRRGMAFPLSSPRQTFWIFMEGFSSLGYRFLLALWRARPLVRPFPSVDCDSSVRSNVTPYPWYPVVTVTTVDAQARHWGWCCFHFLLPAPLRLLLLLPPASATVAVPAATSFPLASLCFFTYFYLLFTCCILLLYNLLICLVLSWCVFVFDQWEPHWATPEANSDW